MKPIAQSAHQHGLNYCPSCGFNIGAFKVSLAFAMRMTEGYSGNGNNEPPPQPKVVTPEPTLRLSAGQRAKAPSRGKGNYFYTEDQNREHMGRCMELRREGKNLHEIAAEIGIPKSRVDRLLAQSKQKKPKKQRLTPGGKLIRAKTHFCPECNKGPFHPAGLGRHRAMAHGVKGSAHATRTYHAKKAAELAAAATATAA